MRFSEVEEDLIMQTVAAEAREFHKRPQLLNPLKLHRMFLAHSFLKKSVTSEEVEITYELHQPNVDTGSISLVGRNISFDNTTALLAATRCADNFDIYTQTDGKLCIDFMFFDLTVLI